MSGLTNLKTLGLSYNPKLSNISDLGGLTNLETLYLSNNTITDISALSGLTNLKTLYVYSNALNLESKKVIESLRASGVEVGSY